MKVLLAFPFRDSDGSRIEAFVRTRECLEGMYEWDDIREFDSGHEPFSRAATRNMAMQYGLDNDYDVVVCCDADSVPEPEPLRDAINGASDGLIHYPFTTVYELIPKASLQVGVQPPSILQNRAISKCESEGGVWVCRPDTWFLAGGQDERFTGWGCEDRAFISASKTLIGDPVKHPGALFCMYHTRPQDYWLTEDVLLLIQYNDAFKDVERMREIIDGRFNSTLSEQISPEECSPAV